MTEGYALAGVLGNAALYIWALGLFAAGQASTMVCTYAGQIIMGGCVQIQLKPWKRTALTRLFALGPALAVSASTYSHQSLFNNINEYLNILQSVQLPFAMLPALHFATSPKLLGRFVSGPVMLVGSYLLAATVIAINIYLILTSPEIIGLPIPVLVFIALYGVFYLGVCLRLVVTNSCLAWLRRLLDAACRRSRVSSIEAVQPRIEGRELTLTGSAANLGADL